MTPIILSLATSLAAAGQIDIDASVVGAHIPRGLYGVFLEEINNAGDGGLYAEMIQNRGFEDANLPPACTLEGKELATPKNPSFWEGYSKNWKMDWPYAGMGSAPFWSIRGGEMRVTTAHALTPQSPHAVEITARPETALVNEGYWGMAVEKGKGYDLSLFMQPLGYRGSFTARVVDAKGQVLAQSDLQPSKNPKWSKVQTTLVATKTGSKGRFELVAKGSGKVLVDFVSLMPADKWRGLPLRRDLADMVAALKPGFVRWPGGCVVEGITIETRPQWKQTLGPLESRTPTFVPWGYWMSNGIGYHEWLLLCEKLGAEPLYVFSAGIACAFRSGTFLPDEQVPALIQDTLDAIEYATGPLTSKYGAMRAKAGHPKPFSMKMVEIGNEAQGPKYGARVKRFMDAIKAKYPKMKVALSSWISGIDHPAIRAAGPGLDVVDEHAYRPVNWAVQNFDSFAKYPRDVPWELYIGEFATNSGVGRGNMQAALGDAAYMMSMEKNADLVKMGSYAPLFENVNRRQWEVNLIHFDDARAFGRASYYACKLFAENQPTFNVKTSVSYAPEGKAPIAGPIGIGTYGTAAEFKDVRLSGKPLHAPWTVAAGAWTKTDDVFKQANLDFDQWSYIGDGYSNIDLSLKARKLSGDEGFGVSVGNADGRRVQFNVGGWGNRQHGLEAAGVIRQVPGQVEANRWYDVRVVTSDRNVKAYLDGKLIFDETLPRTDTVLAVAGSDEESGDLIVKAVNTSGLPAPVTLSVTGASLTGQGSLDRLSSRNPLAENSFDTPRLIVPGVRPLQFQGTSLREVLPPYSISIYRLKTAK